jgi:hypothetical protein
MQNDKLVMLLSSQSKIDHSIIIFRVEPSSIRFVRSFSLYEVNEGNSALPSLAGKPFVDFKLVGEYIFALEENGLVRIFYLLHFAYNLRYLARLWLS